MAERYTSQAKEAIKYVLVKTAQKGLFDAFNLLLFLMISSRQVRPERLFSKLSQKPGHAPNASNLDECFG